MVTVGEILQRAREKKKLTVEQVEKATRIRAKFIVALEQNQFEKLPGPIFERGFVKNYATYLGLPVEETLAFYRRQANRDKLESTINLPSNKIARTSLVTPQRFTFFSIGILLISFLGYLIFSYWQFAGSPILIIDKPLNNTVASEPVVEVIGKTDQNAKVVINNEPININENGSFDIKVPLQPGLNTLTIVASNKFGKSTTIKRDIRLEK